MNACCVFLILIIMCYRVSHATNSQEICKVQLQTVRAPVGSNVDVTCPEMHGKEITFILYKDNETISECRRDPNHNGTTCKPTDICVVTKVHKNATKESVHFRFTVNASSPGIYRCDTSVTFPPPFRKTAGDQWTLLIVEDPKCSGSKDTPPKTGGVQNSLLLWWILVPVLSLYSITVTIIAFIYWRKLNNADLQNDYINTKPSVPRNRGKKKGVTNPIPRHF